MIKYITGQINIATMVTIFIAIAVPTLGGYYANLRATGGKIENIETLMSADIHNVEGTVNVNSQRISKLEEAISTIKADNAETRKRIEVLIELIYKQNGIKK